MNFLRGGSGAPGPQKAAAQAPAQQNGFREKSMRERSAGVAGGSSMKMRDELTLLRQAKAALEAQLEHERGVSYELRKKLDAVTSLGSPQLGSSGSGNNLSTSSLTGSRLFFPDDRRGSNATLGGYTVDPDSLAPADDDDEVQAETMGAAMIKRPTGSQKGKSVVAKRRVSNLNTVAAVRQRGLQREESSRSTDFIAKMLNEHIAKRATENKFANIVSKVVQSNRQGRAGSTAATAVPDGKNASSSSGLNGTPASSTSSSSLTTAPPGGSNAGRDTSVASDKSNNRRKSSMAHSKTSAASSASAAGATGSGGPDEKRPLHNRTPSFLRKVLAHRSVNRADGDVKLEGLYNLPRGGVLVTTSAGLIQFGMVPETIKDSMELGLSVPSIFVVPPERFNLHEGVNVGEIEFPAFFNFFVLRKKVRMVTWRETVEDLRNIMQEALLGPRKENIFVDSEYSKFCSKEVYEQRPNLVKEMEYFAAPRAPDFYKITIDELIQFEFFDDEGMVELGMGVSIKDDLKDGFTIVDAGTEPRKRLGSKNLDADASGTDNGADDPFADLAGPSSLFIPYERASSCLSVPPSLKASAEAGETGSFVIPQFGVTILGNSHGFDAEGSTSGFVVWVNGQGAMVDPPPHSSMLLMKAGIQPKAVSAIILTHCHADHEVGTIQKMVTEDKVVLMTTRTIMESFLRKYEAVTGLEASFLAQLVNFRPVYLEEPTYWNGAAFRFFYSLHSIPCIGFECNFEGKRVVYSADTYYDPDGLQAMHASGVLSAGRLSALMNFPWDADVVLHEMGVPPIHTPLEALEKLPEKFRKHIYLIHIGAKTARDAKKRGFKIATPGVENTLTLIKAPEQEDDMMKFFQLISTMDIFRGFSLAQALELWFMAKSMQYAVGAHIVEEGTPGDKFMIISRGSASVTFGGNKKVFKSGDFLGEVSVVTGAVRTATVVADTPVSTFEVDRYAFDYLVMHDPRLRIRMENLIKARSDGSWSAIMTNSLLSKFTSSQKTQLQALLSVRTLKRGDMLWSKGEPVRIGVLIAKGGLKFAEVHHDLKPTEEAPLTSGMFIFDMLGVMNSYPLTTTLVVHTDVALVFSFDGESIMNYMDSNPLLLLGLLKSIVII